MQDLKAFKAMRVPTTPPIFGLSVTQANPNPMLRYHPNQRKLVLVPAMSQAWLLSLVPQALATSLPS
jgi:hypothetical protein